MFYEGRGIQITALPTERAACCLYEETERSRGSKPLPVLPQSSLTQEPRLVTEEEVNEWCSYTGVSQ